MPRIRFGLCALLIAATAIVMPAQHLSYYGGPVVSSPRYYIVLWGNGNYESHVTSTGTPSVATFLQNTGTAFSWLNGEYNTANSNIHGTKTNQYLVEGTYGGSYTITPAHTANPVSDSSIQAELQSQIAAGHLPAPLTDSLGYGITIYVVYFPHGVSIKQGGSGSCVAGGFCAYHGTIQPASGGHYFYAVMPDMQAGSGCDLGCGNASTAFGNYTSVLSHELAETITDADVGLATITGPPLAWYDDSNGEIGDICNAEQGTFTGSDAQTYVIQLLWSNAQRRCIGPQPVSPLTNDFSLSANPASLTFVAGGNGSAAINSAVVSGNATTINLSASGLPAGVSASFTPSSITSGQSSTLDLTSTSAAAPGVYSITVTGTVPAGFSAMEASGLRAAGNSFSIGASRSPLSVSQGSGGSVAVSTALIDGLPETVSLSVSGLPNGVTASFSPAILSSGQASTLYLVASDTAHAGTVAVTITGTAASGSHSATFPLTVTPPAAGGQSVVNGGFETGDLGGWTSSGAFAVVGSSAHSGKYAALVGSNAPTNGYSSLSQTFIPLPGATQLSVSYAIHCPDTVSSDWATITLRDNTFGRTSTLLPKTCDNSGQWSTLAVALTAGHSYTLTLTNHDDRYPGDATYTLFDDVVLSSPVAMWPPVSAPAWTQIGAAEAAQAILQSPPKPPYRGTAFMSRVTPSATILNSASALSAVHSVNITLTITGAVTVSISNIPTNAVYGGSFTPTFSYNGDGTTSATTSTGTCTISNSVVSFVGVGTCTLTAHATAGATSPAVDGSPQSFTIGQATTTVSINNLPANAVYGGSFTATFAYTGDGSTSVTSTTPSNCTVSGGVVNFAGVGSCILTAHASAGTNYKAVDGVAQSFTIGQATTTVSIDNLPANAVYGGSFTPTFAYTGDGTTSVTSGTSGTCTVSGGVVNFAGVGSCILTAHASAGTNYKAVDGVAQSFTIGQATTTVSINNLPANPVYGGSFTPTFAYAGDGTTSVTSTTPSICAVSGGVVNFAGVGSCILTAHASAGTNYKAVDGVAQSFTIGQATTTVSINNLPANAVYGGSFTPTFAYTGDGSTSVTSTTSSTCTVSGGVVNFAGVGSCILAAHASAGTNYKAVDGVAQSFTINQATTTTNIVAPSITYGASGAVTVTVTSQAGAVAGSVALSVDGGFPMNMTLSASGSASFTLPALGAGNHGLSASFAATGNFLGSMAGGSLLVNKAMASVTPNPASKTYGTVDPPLTGTLSGFLPADNVMAVYSRTGGQAAGSYTIGATLSPSNALQNYTIAYNTATFTINKAALTVTANSFSQPYGTPIPVLSYVIAGFVNGDQPWVVSGAPALSTAATAASFPGPYPITIGPGTLSALNYIFNLAGGTLTVTFTASAPASGNSCNGAYNGTFSGNVNVTSGQNCIFIGGGVTGNVQQNGGNLELIQAQTGNDVQVTGGGTFTIGPGSYIKGNLQIQNIPAGSAANQICGTTVNGDLTFHNNGTSVVIGSANGCAGNTIGGNLTVQGNTAATTVDGNKVTGNLQDQNNTAATAVFTNTVGKNLQCQGNSSITGGGNTAGSKQGQCALF